MKNLNHMKVVNRRGLKNSKFLIFTEEQNIKDF